MKEFGKSKLSVIVAILAIFVLIAGLAIAGKTGTISGTVKDSVTSAAIVGATVTAGSYTATTNSTGAYSMSANAGNYTVTASATGYTPASQSATVVVGQTKTVNFSLVKTVNTNGTLSGTVKDSVTSAAIVGATVKAGTATATTDSTGSYSMSVAAGPYTVTASATGYTTGSQPGTVTQGQTTIVNFLLVTAPVSSNYKVIAWNDLGMHCACPGAQTFLLLPPFNTLRAQVLKYGGNDPTVVSSGVTVSYNIVEDTKARLDADPYYQNWVTYAPKIFPGYNPKDTNGNYVGIWNPAKKLSDTMEYNATTMGYEAIGIPAFPVVTGTNTDIMTDPLGTGPSYPNRTPYLTGAITVKDSTGATVATTSTTVPVAFGGCCTCHLPLAAQHGYAQTPVGSFQYMGFLHSGGNAPGKINFALLDPDGDGVGGPVRCSWCHWDPAMGEAKALGVPAGYKILAGANFTTTNVNALSTKTFSEVLHGFHSNSAAALAMDPYLATTNCYACHPGNNVNCFRGAMLGHAQCKDCHGDLIQRAATNQLKAPWQQSTLPTCNAPSPGITSAVVCHDSRLYPNTTATWTGVFGKFLNSRGHKGSIQCLTCHGSPHAEVPSSLAKDNAQLISANNGLSKPLGVCTFCHPGKSSTWGGVPHGSIRR